MARKTHTIASYFAVFDPAEEGGYNVSFPDFPGCATFGRNFEEAKEKATEILELWIPKFWGEMQLLGLLVMILALVV